MMASQLSLLSSIAQLRWVRLALATLAALAITIWLWPSDRKHYNLDHSEQAWDDLKTIENTTLGFGKIFAINLPSRPDKNDNIALGSSVCNFYVDYVDGVIPEEINPKSYPYNWNKEFKGTEYAARRAHVNGIKRVVQERIGSAIIMEDDADWDVNIRKQLQSFALGVRALQGTTNTPTSSPYGDDWDILWIGHCGVECREDQPFYRVQNDSTVPGSGHFLPYWRDAPAFKRLDHARLTCAAKDGVCSSVYAVSYHGAQRILAALSVNPSGLAEEIDIGAQFDVSLGRMCGQGYLRCFAPYPALTGAFRAAGGAEKSSDIHDQVGEPVGFASWGVTYSTMLNVKRILNGDPVSPTWDDIEPKWLIPSMIDIKEGAIYVKDQNGEHEIPSVDIDENLRQHRQIHVDGTQKIST